ncbi:hypothetical protein P9112_009936 [Eukaryota sp. TZLM1-RC]
MYPRRRFRRRRRFPNRRARNAGYGAYGRRSLRSLYKPPPSRTYAPRKSTPLEHAIFPLNPTIDSSKQAVKNLLAQSAPYYSKDGKWLTIQDLTQIQANSQSTNTLDKAIVIKGIESRVALKATKCSHPRARVILFIYKEPNNPSYMPRYAKFQELEPGNQTFQADGFPEAPTSFAHDILPCMFASYDSNHHDAAYRNFNYDPKQPMVDVFSHAFMLKRFQVLQDRLVEFKPTDHTGTNHIAEFNVASALNLWVDYSKSCSEGGNPYVAKRNRLLMMIMTDPGKITSDSVIEAVGGTRILYINRSK